MDQSYYFKNAAWVGKAERTEKTFSVLRGRFNVCSIKRVTLNVLGLGFFKCYINGKCINPDTFLPLSSDFEATCDFARRAGFLMIHVFPYSKRRGTVAAEMKGQIPESVKHERVKVLTGISREIRSRILDEKIANGSPIEVLFETCRDGFAHGHTSDFIEVRVKTDKNLHGLFRSVSLISHDGDVCEGRIID